MVSVPLLTERMGVSYFEENLLELYLQVRAKIPPDNLACLRTSVYEYVACGWVCTTKIYNSQARLSENA